MLIQCTVIKQLHLNFIFKFVSTLKFVFSGSSDDDEILDENEPEPEIDGEMQLVTEVWLEPQHGLVTESPPERSYLDGLPYTLIANQVRIKLYFFFEDSLEILI